jgi:hypothetical protein
MYRFHVCLHARPREAPPGATLEIEGRSIATLTVSPALLGEPFATSFEDAAAALSALSRMFFEPDGSFVWVSSGDAAWQVEGCLFDREGRLQYVELKGSCPEAAFDELLRSFGWPATPLVFQLVRQAAFLDESEFRKLAASRDVF